MLKNALCQRKSFRGLYLVAATLSTLGVSLSPAFGDEFVLGFGIDDFLDQTDTQSGAFVFEYHANPFYEGKRSEYSIAVAGQVDGDGDIFVGVGPYALWSLGDGPWFAEASLMPGYYSQGTGGSPLDGNFQIRTLLGVGLRLTDHSRVSLAIDHKSNAGIEGTNPGNETLSLRYAFSF